MLRPCSCGFRSALNLRSPRQWWSQTPEARSLRHPRWICSSRRAILSLSGCLPYPFSPMGCPRRTHRLPQLPSICPMRSWARAEGRTLRHSATPSLTHMSFPAPLWAWSSWAIVVAGWRGVMQLCVSGAAICWLAVRSPNALVLYDLGLLDGLRISHGPVLAVFVRASQRAF